MSFTVHSSGRDPKQHGPTVPSTDLDRRCLLSREVNMPASLRRQALPQNTTQVMLGSTVVEVLWRRPRLEPKVHRD